MLLANRRNILEIWSKVFGDMEKTYLVILGENVSTNRRNRSAILEKNPSGITLEIWRNVVDAVMAISYWSSSCSSIELGDRKWMLNHNRDKTETSYGDQNFTEYKIREYISRVFQG